MNRPTRRLAWAVAALLAALPAVADFPARQDARVNDFARLLSAAEGAELRGLLADFQRDTGVELVVVTVPSWRGYGTRDAAIEPFATGLFDRWGIGDRERNDGALLLVARDERELRIELGAGFGRRYDRRMQRVVDDTLLPRFRAGEMGRGIVEGARAIAVALEPGWSPGAAGSPQTATPQAAPPGPPAADLPAEAPPGATPPAGQPQPAPVDLGRRTPFGLATGWALALLAAVAAAPVLLVVLLFRFLRRGRGKRRCPDCDGTLHRLTEVADDAHLTPGQQAEEAVASVDYRVWACDACDRVDVKEKRRWFSGRKRCPRCGFKTLETDSQVVDAPTTLSTGLERRSENCPHCQHHHVREVVLAMLSDDDRRSSSSFGGSSSGGGRSGGGGASGSW